LTTESSDVGNDDAVDFSYSSIPPLDVEKYRKYIEDVDIDAEQQVEFLRVLWSIMATFVDLGFGVDSVQRCLPALAEFSFDAESDEVEKKDSTRKFNEAAEGKNDQ